MKLGECGGEGSPTSRRFYRRKGNWAYLWINSLKCYKLVFILCPSRVLSKYIKTKVLNSCFSLIKTFFKSKKRPKTSLPASFSARFLKKKKKKKFSHRILITAQVSLPDCLYFWRYWAIKMCIVIICCQDCEAISFKINLVSFLIK